MTAELTPALAFRLILLGVVSVIVQIAAVSQIEFFGVNADLTPLIVAFAAFLCGSLEGAVFGFAVGLFLDLALMQTLGVSSLLLTAVGYVAGRVRELRDPQGAVVPVVVGAVATLGTAVGFSLMQFLLGLDAPVSFDLAKEIVVTTIVNAIVSVPVYWAVRRWLTPALPHDPRRRRRRASTTGGLSPLSRA
jgi:rod shape-determining protein MreD